MVAIKDMEMPKNCVECNHMDLQQAINCQLIYSGCANCGRHPNCPLIEIEERKTGEWIFAYGTKGKDNVEKCSCCGSHWKEAIIYRTDTQEYLRTRLPYCPNCGSKNER